MLSLHEIRRQGSEQLDFEIVVRRGGVGGVEVGVRKGVVVFGEVTVFERRHGLDGIGEGVGAGEHEGGEVLEAGVEGALLW